MKLLLIIAGTALLGACSSVPVLQSSFGGDGYVPGPTSASDPRLRQPRFYRQEGDSMPWLNQAPRNNR